MDSGVSTCGHYWKIHTFDWVSKIVTKYHTNYNFFHMTTLGKMLPIWNVLLDLDEAEELTKRKAIIQQWTWDNGVVPYDFTADVGEC